MDVRAARELFDEQLRQGARPSQGTDVQRTAQVVREMSREPKGWAAVVWSNLDAANADRQIAEELAYFADRGRAFEWKHYDGDLPADLPDRLQANGFVAEPPEALMITEISDLDLSQGPPAGVEIVEVADEVGIAAMVEVASEVFGRDHTGIGAEILHLLRVEPESMSVVLAMADGRPISSARTDFHLGTRFASLWGGGTLPQWRGRGVYRAMVAHRARVAQQRGYSYLRVDASPESEPILTRLGFVRAGTTTPYQSPTR